VGIALFYEFDFFSGLPERAGGVALLGLLICAIAAWADTLRGVAAGLAVVFVGCAIWVQADWWSLEWEVGNLLGVFGAAFSAFSAWRRG
jgi:hypothetical protein